MVVNRQFVRDGNTKYLEILGVCPAAMMAGCHMVLPKFIFLSIITISADLPRLRVRLLAFAYSSMLSSSGVRLSALIAGTMRYVSSAYLASEFPAVTGVASAALSCYC